jgi:putative ABC transport system permease protein
MWQLHLAKLTNLMRREGRACADLDEEIQAHVEIEVEENIAKGMPADEARFAAMRTFGNIALAEEHSREAWSFCSVEALWSDLRLAARMLRKAPSFSVIAVLTLAIGIGANTAIFSVVRSVLLKSLPYPNPERLVVLNEYNLRAGNRTVSWLDFLDWRRRTHVFEQMAAYRLTHVTLTKAGEPMLLRAADTSASFLPMLGATPMLGRNFNEAEDGPGATPAAVMSYALWRDRFGGDRQVIGKTLALDGTAYSVVGVLPPDFTYFQKRVDLYLPLGRNGNDPLWNRRGFHPDLLVLGKLRSGQSIEAARDEMNSMMRQMEREYPLSNAGLMASVTPLSSQRVADVRRTLFMLLAAVGCVLLIACVNVANLLLARATTRQKEIAIRCSLGAGRKRIIRQLLTESVLLAIIGGGLGLVLASALLHPLLRLAPSDIPRLSETRLDGPVLLFTFAIAVLTGIFFGVIPALHSSKVDLNSSLKENSRASSGGNRGRVRSMLLVTEVALAVTLVVCSGLLLRSLINAQYVDPGFDAHHLLALDVMLPESKYVNPEQKVTFFTQAVDRLQALPGVRAAGAAFCPPLVGICASNAFTIAGDNATTASLPTAGLNIVVPGYFGAMQVPVIEGRLFTGADNAQSARVALVNQAMARRWWPGGSALGKRIREGGIESKEPYREIIGVVGDVRQQGMDRDGAPEIYLPATQFPFAPWDSLQAMTMVVRAGSDPMSIATVAKNAIQTLDPDLPVTAIQPMTQYMSQSLARREFSTALLAVFAGLALLLASIGIYGVVAYNVSQRTHEIGTRMALGAQAAHVLRLVVGQALLLTAIGASIGTVGAFLSARSLASLLFGIRDTDPVTFAGMILVVFLLAMIASYAPARRALRIEPMLALRQN